MSLKELLDRLFEAGIETSKRLVAGLSGTPKCNGEPDTRQEGHEHLIGPIPAYGSGPESHTALRSAFLRLVSSTNTTMVCDIGANDGTLSQTALRAKASLEVYGFEANPYIFEKFCDANTKMGIHWINCAVSDAKGTATLFIPTELTRAYMHGEIVPAYIIEQTDTGKSSILMRDEKAKYKTCKVRCTTLDHELPTRREGEEERHICLWIDVEGAADRVLKGASDALSRVLAIVVEVEGFKFWKGQSSVQDVAILLERSGFFPAMRDREYEDLQFNVLFVHHSVRDIAAEVVKETMFPAESYPIRTGGKQYMAGRPAATARLHYPESHIPVIIPCFNNPTYVKQMYSRLRGIGLPNVILVDGHSTYPPMLDLLDEISRQSTVVCLKDNFGPHHFFHDEEFYNSLPAVFCVTDPDLDLNELLPLDFLHQLTLLTCNFEVGKAGFALDISRRDLFRAEKFLIGSEYFHIWQWEAQFWPEPLTHLASGDAVYLAPVDTTFAVYNKQYFRPEVFLRAIRVGGRFTARHLPWYLNSSIPMEELKAYSASRRHSFYSNHSYKL